MSIFAISSHSNHVNHPFKSLGAEILREGLPPTVCHVSHVMCHMSSAMRHMPHVTHLFLLLFFSFGQSGETSR